MQTLSAYGGECWEMRALKWLKHGIQLNKIRKLLLETGLPEPYAVA